MMRTSLLLAVLLTSPSGVAQEPPNIDQRLFDIAEAVSAENLEADISALVDFGTRHTMSETESESRGIGAARRWYQGRLEAISSACEGCLEVHTQTTIVPAGSPRIPIETEVVNVYAIQRGTLYPDRYVLLVGDIDNRVSDGLDASSDNPGANDNASGLAATLEAARVLSQYSFGKSIVYAGLSGEEQGLYGGKFLAELAKAEGWIIEGLINNDMIGNIEGVDGVIDNVNFRIFSEPVPVAEDEDTRRMRRFTGGEVDGPSRQLARYIARLSEEVLEPRARAVMIYRLDRWGRGGHHRPFNDAGFPAVRLMEMHENYDRQHQDLRHEDGIDYGDVLEGVDFDYAAKLVAADAIALASLAWAPPPPEGLLLSGAVKPAAKLEWEAIVSDDLAGFAVYWRDTTAPQWQRRRFVGNQSEALMKGLIIDNFLFGVAAVGHDGNESVVVFPTPKLR